MRRALTAVAIGLLVSCGGDDGRSYVPTGGFVRIEEFRTELVQASATLRNTPTPVHFAGVPMPATLGIRIESGGSEGSSVYFEIACGPDGDFFAGREVMPASVRLETQGTTSFPPADAYPTFSAFISENPLLADTLGYSIDLLFRKGGVEYECSAEGQVAVTIGTEYRDDNLPRYPPLSAGDSLFFQWAGDNWRPKAGAVLLDSAAASPVARLMVFADSVPPADLTKPEGTRLEVLVPASMLGRGPVPGLFTFHLEERDTVLTADPRFGFVDAGLTDGRLVGRMAFIANGSAARTGFRGGGPFDLKVR